MKLHIPLLSLLAALLSACQNTGPETARMKTLTDEKFGISYQVEEDALVNQRDTADDHTIRVVYPEPNGHFTVDLSMYETENPAFLDSTMEWFAGRKYDWMVEAPIVDTLNPANLGSTLHTVYRTEMPVEGTTFISKLYMETFWFKRGDQRYQMIFAATPETEAAGRKALAALIKSIKLR